MASRSMLLHKQVILIQILFAGVYFIVYAAVAGLYAAIGTAWNGLIADVCPDDTRGSLTHT